MKVKVIEVSIIRWIERHRTGFRGAAFRRIMYVIKVDNMANLHVTFSAFSKGGRWPYLWLATILHGLWTDNFWHFALPEYDNFWHSQTPIIFLGARLPLHIILLCEY